MHGNVKPLATFFIEFIMVVLVPEGYVVSDDTNVSVLLLPRDVGTQTRHATFEKIDLCLETISTKTRVDQHKQSAKNR